MLAESLGEYSVERASENYGEQVDQAPVGLMNPGREMHVVAYSANCMEQKQASAPTP